MTLHLYFARKFIWIFLGLTLLLSALSMLFDLVDTLRGYDMEEVGFWPILQLLLLNMPRGTYQILPLIMILSAIVLFLSLARSSELVVTRASGRGALIALLSPITVGFLIGIIGVATLNPIAASTTRQYEALSASLKAGGISALSISREGLWLRQGGERGQTVIYAGKANHNATQLQDVTFLSYDASGAPAQRIRASEAALAPGGWDLKQAKIWPLADGMNPEAEAQVHAELRIDSNLTVEQIRDSFGKLSAVSVWELPRLIAQLEDAGFSSRRHVMWWHMELAQPLFLVAMVLVAAAFTMRHTRFGRTGLAVLAATLSGFGLYYIRNFAQILGENGQLPVTLAAWAPPIASVFLALGLLLHMEEG